MALFALDSQWHVNCTTGRALKKGRNTLRVLSRDRVWLGVPGRGTDEEERQREKRKAMGSKKAPALVMLNSTGFFVKGEDPTQGFHGRHRHGCHFLISTCSLVLWLHARRWARDGRSHGGRSGGSGKL